MTTVEYKINLVLVSPSEYELTTVAETLEFAVRRRNLFQGHLARQGGIILSVVETVELRDGFDKASLAFDRFNQTQAVLLDGRVVQAEYRNRADQQCRCGHNQKQLVEGLALNHSMSWFAA